MSVNNSPTPSLSSTLNEQGIRSFLKGNNSVRNSASSLSSLEKLRYKFSTPTSSLVSFSDDGSDGSVSTVPSRFTFNPSTITSSVEKLSAKAKAKKLYRPKKYCKRQSKEVSALPQELQILYERGSTQLNSKYDLLNRKLGDGAMGSVYLVQRKGDGKLFAAKIHTKDHPKLTQPQYLQRISDEILIASSLHHDHIISTFDFVSNGSKYMTIMEYCPSDFFDLISSNTLTESQIDHYFVQLLLGVHHMHSKGVAHRDLKLENLCVDHEGKLKIIDFGCATQFRSTFASSSSPVKGVFGSDPYIAPEIWSQHFYDAEKADLFSLAIIYVAMHSGRFLWDKAIPEDSKFASFPKKCHSIFSKFQIPEHARPILLRLLDTNPSTRASMSEVFAEPWIQSILS